QELVMSWLIGTRGPQKETKLEPGSRALSDYIHNLVSTGAGDFREQEAIVGLTGLIRLGGAWQSPDVYWAIGSLYSYPDQAMADVADLRAQEIVDSGGKSFDPSYVRGSGEEHYISGPPLETGEVREFWRLRRLADKWNADRQAFMMARLKAGRHPDTDPHFWDGAPAMPEFKVQQSVTTWLNSKMRNPGVMVGIAALIY